MKQKNLWERMKEANKGKEPPQFMSTHPSSSKRIKNLKEWENRSYFGLSTNYNWLNY